MRPDLRNSIRPTFLGRDIKTRHEVYVFLICVAISLFLWILIKASAESEATVSFPLEFVNMPEDKILIEAPVTKVTLGFEEKAANLFFFKYFKERKPIRISVQNLSLKKHEESYTGTLFTNNIMDYLNRQEEIPFTIISISPDTIPIIFEEKISKKLPVVSDIKLNFRKQFDLYDSVRIIPESVLVSGPASQLDTLDSVNIGAISLNNLAESKDIIINPENLYPGLISFEPEEINVQIPVEQYTEAKAEVPLLLEVNSPYSVRTFPANIKVTYLVALKDFAKVTPDQFKVIVEADSAALSSNQKLKVKLTASPPNVRVMYLEPEKVEFIIQK